METLSAIQGRRSIRAFDGTPVTNEQLETILRAAMFAPSAGNAQPWQFVVIDDKELHAKILAIHPYAGALKNAPVAVLVCGDTRMEKYPGYWVQDCSAAIQNLLLAAHDIGLGAVWCGIYPDPERIHHFQKLFHVPDGVFPLAIVPIGRPVKTITGVERYLPERIHKNSFPFVEKE